MKLEIKGKIRVHRNVSMRNEQTQKVWGEGGGERLTRSLKRRAGRREKKELLEGVGEKVDKKRRTNTRMQNTEKL